MVPVKSVWLFAFDCGALAGYAHILSAVAVSVKLAGAMISRGPLVVVPGGKMELAMQLVLTPLIWRMVETGRKARAHVHAV
jgi:uncharacterized membrane protein (DUF4010 family)